MTKQDFLSNYYCKIDLQDQGNIRVITTSVYTRNANNLIDRIRSDHDIREINEVIGDAIMMTPLRAINWDKIIDFTLRAHLDTFAQIFDITDYYALNKEDNPDISDMYK